MDKSLWLRLAREIQTLSAQQAVRPRYGNWAEAGVCSPYLTGRAKRLATVSDRRWTDLSGGLLAQSRDFTDCSTTLTYWLTNNSD